MLSFPRVFAWILSRLIRASLFREPDKWEVYRPDTLKHPTGTLVNYRTGHVTFTDGGMEVCAWMPFLQRLCIRRAARELMIRRGLQTMRKSDKT